MIVERVADDKALPIVRQDYRYPCNLLKCARSFKGNSPISSEIL